MAAADNKDLSLDLSLAPRSDSGERFKPLLTPSAVRSSRGRIPSLEEVRTKEEGKWTIYSGSQNLSAAINDPSSRELDLFTKTWGSYFVPTARIPSANLPTIEVTDFMRYIRETSSGRKVHRNIARQLSKEESETFWSPGSPEEIRPLRQQLQQDGRNYDLSTVPRIFMQRSFCLEDPPTFQEVLPVAKLLPKKKSSPKSMPEPDDSTRTPRPLKGKNKMSSLMADNHQSFKLLHEKLTHYLDIIEVHLAYEISQRSDIFFSTLSSQQELQSYIMQIRQDVMELRHKLREVGSVSTRGSLQLYKKCTRFRRYSEMVEKLKLISTVQQTQPTIQLLLRGSDFVGALDLITTTQEVLEQELNGVHALRHLGSQLAELESAIEKMMESDFVEFAMEDIRHRLEQTREESPLGDEGGESEERLTFVVMGLLRQGKLHFLAALRESLLAFLKAKVKGIISGYLQMEQSGEEPPSIAECMRTMTFQAWMELLSEVFDRMLHCQRAVQDSIEVISSACKSAGGLTVTMPTKSTSPPSTPVKPLTPSTQVDPMTPSTLVDPLTPILPLSSGYVPSLEEYYADNNEAEDRLAQLMMDEELSDSRLVGRDSSAEDEAQLVVSVVKDDLNVVRNGVGVSEVGVTKNERTEDSREFNRMEDSMTPAGVSSIISYVECQRLLLDCQDISNSSCLLVHARCAKILGIRAKAGLLKDLVPSDFLLLVQHVEDFVRRSGLVTGMCCPSLRIALQSQAKSFLDYFHDNRRKQLSLLLEGEHWKQAGVPAEIQVLINKLDSGIVLPFPGKTSAVMTSEPSSNIPPTKYLVIHGNNFTVVGTVLLFVKMLLEYCHYADNLPYLINEVMTRLIELIKYFNYRTCELVLGAGAMNAVGLKAITARHLAIMMQCLESIKSLIPDLCAHFKSRLERQHHVLLTQFDTVTKDFTNHCNQVRQKLTTIMDEIILKHLIKWEVKGPVPSPCFKSITRQIVKLHENLEDILSPQQLQALFRSIEIAFQSRLKEKLIKLGITNDGSTKHGIVNSELHYCGGVLGSLENISVFGNSLFDVWTS